MEKASWQLHLINLPQGTYHVPGSTQNSEGVRPYTWQEGTDAAAGHTASRGQQRTGPILSEAKKMFLWRRQLWDWPKKKKVDFNSLPQEQNGEAKWLQTAQIPDCP